MRNYRIIGRNNSMILGLSSGKSQAEEGRPSKRLTHRLINVIQSNVSTSKFVINMNMVNQNPMLITPTSYVTVEKE